MTTDEMQLLDMALGPARPRRARVAEFPVGPPVWAEAPSGDLWGAEAALRTVVDFIARKISTLPWHAYRVAASGERVRAEGSELAALIARPSAVPSQTRSQLLHALIVDWLLWDRMLALVVTDASGAYRLRRVPPQDFTVDFNALGEPVRVRVMTGNGRDASFGLPDPRVVMRLGYGGAAGAPRPVPDAVAPLLSEAREMARYRREVASNSGRVPAWVSRGAGVQWASDEAREEFVTGLRAYRSGGGSEGGWPLLEDGMAIHELSAFKPVEMADLDARSEIATQICTAYHVSPENVGFRTSTKSGMQAYKEQLWNVELRPYIVELEETVNLTVPEALGEPGLWVRANLDAQLRGTTSEQYQALSTATGRPFMATDEARDILDLPKIGDGFDRPVTPLNVLAGGSPSPQDGGVTQNAQQGRRPGGRD